MNPDNQRIGLEFRLARHIKIKSLKWISRHLHIADIREKLCRLAPLAEGAPDFDSGDSNQEQNAQSNENLSSPIHVDKVSSYGRSNYITLKHCSGVAAAHYMLAVGARQNSGNYAA